MNPCAGTIEMSNPLKILLLISILLVLDPRRSFSQIFDSPVSLRGVHHGQVELVDMDGDDDLDILLSGIEKSVLPTTIIYENTGSGHFKLNVLNNLTGLLKVKSPTGQIAGKYDIGDLDHDGLLDFLFTRQNTTWTKQTYPYYLKHFEQLQDGTTSNFDEVYSQWTFRAHSLYLQDFDNNGKLDLLTYQSQHYEIDEDLVGLQLHNQILTDYTSWAASGIRIKAVFDMNSDNLVDILAIDSEYTNQVELSMNSGNANFSPITIELQYSITDLVVGDINNDGRPDIVAVHADQGITLLTQSDEASFSTEYHQLTGTYFNSLKLVDVDNDGLLDLAGFNSAYNEKSKVYLYRNLGNQFEKFDFNSPFAYYADIQFGDLNQDGFVDLLVSGMLPEFNVFFPASLLYFGNSFKNSFPDPPSQLEHFVDGEKVSFEWSPGLDAETPGVGLSYSLQVKSVSEDSETSIVRDVKSTLGGNIFQNNTWYLDNLSPGAYTWSIQTVDQSMVRSRHSQERSFTIEGSPPRVSGFESGVLAGEKFTIEGSNFTTVHSVKLDSLDLTFQMKNSKTIMARAPDFSFSGKLILVNDYGSSQSEEDFCVVSMAPRICGGSYSGRNCLDTASYSICDPLNSGTYVWVLESGGHIYDNNETEVAVVWDEYGRHELKVAHVLCDTGTFASRIEEFHSPVEKEIRGNNEVQTDTYEDYRFTPEDDEYYEWELSGGGIVTEELWNGVTIKWLEAGNHVLRLISYQDRGVSCTNELVEELKITVSLNEFGALDTLALTSGDVKILGFADMDDDEDKDVLLSDGNLLIQNESNTYVFQSTNLSWNAHKSLGATFEDFDKDGDIDIVRRHSEPYDPALTIFKNNGDYSFVNTYECTLNQVPLVFDPNRDGLQDLVFTSNSKREIKILQNHGDFAFEEDVLFQDPRVQAPLTNELHAYDINGDGYKEVISRHGDILLGKSNGKLEIHDNLEIPQQVTELNPDINSFFVNKDGANYLISLNDVDEVALHWVFPGNPFSEYFLFDFDGDGLRDIVIFRDNQTEIFLQNEASFSFDKHQKTFSGRIGLIKLSSDSLGLVHLDGTDLYTYKLNKFSVTNPVIPTGIGATVDERPVRLVWEKNQNSWTRVSVGTSPFLNDVIGSEIAPDAFGLNSLSQRYENGSVISIDSLEPGSYYWALQAIGLDGSISDFSDWYQFEIDSLRLESPDNLKLYQGVSTELILSWADNSASENGFSIERYDYSLEKFVSESIVGANVTNYRFSVENNVQEEKFRIQAFNDSDTSLYSAIVSSNEMIAADFPLVEDFESNYSIWLTQNLGWRIENSEIDGFGARSLKAGIPQSVLLSPFMDLADIRSPFITLEIVTIGEGFTPGQISMELNFNEDDCWEPLTTNYLNLGNGKYRVWANPKARTSVNDYSNVRIKIENWSADVGNFFLDNINVFKGPTSDFSDTYIISNNEVELYERGIECNQNSAETVDIRWKPQEHSTHYILSRAYSGELRHILDTLAHPITYFQDSISRNGVSATYTVTPYNEDYGVNANFGITSFYINGPPLIFTPDSILAMNLLDTVSFSVPIQDELQIDSLHVDVFNVSSEEDLIDTLFFEKDSGNLVITVVSKSQNGRITIGISVRDQYFIANDDLQLTIGDYNAPPKITGHVDLIINEHGCLTIQPEDIQVEDEDNIFPDDFQLIILDGENHETDSSTLCMNSDFTGMLELNIVAYDGNDSSQIFPLNININDVPDISFNQVSLSSPEDEKIPYDALRGLLEIEDSDDSIHAIHVHQGDFFVPEADSLLLFLNYTGDLSIPVSVSDETSESDTVLIHLQVAAVNDPPAVKPIETDQFVDEEDTVPITLEELTIDDPDDSIHYIKLFEGEHYAILSEKDPAIMLEKDFAETVFVRYAVSDGKSLSDTLTLKLFVSNISDPPNILGQKEPWEETEDFSFTIHLDDLIYTDPDPRACCQSKYVLEIGDGENYRIENDNKIVPSGNYHGPLTVPVRIIEDGRHYSNLYHLKISVASVNDLPNTRGLLADKIDIVDDTIYLEQSYFWVEDPDHDSVFVLPYSENGFRVDENGLILYAESAVPKDIYGESFIPLSAWDGQDFELSPYDLYLDDIGISVTAAGLVYNEEHGVKIFPNPNTGLFKIEKPQTSLAIKAISIHDISGNLIKQITYQKQPDVVEVRLPAPGSGVYILLIQFENDTISKVKVLVE